MRMFKGACVAVMMAVSISHVWAADFVNLEWGEFKISYESAVKPKSVTTENRNGELRLSMSLDGFSAGADGAKLEGSSSMAGEFVIEQPSYAKLPSMSIQLKGTLVKTAGTTAEMLVNIGNAQQKLEWGSAEQFAGIYTKVLNVEVPDGRLPVPFPVSVQAFVKRDSTGGGILMTLDSVDIRLGQSGMAQFLPAAPQVEFQSLTIMPLPGHLEDRR